jgi:hypothetical protein
MVRSMAVVLAFVLVILWLTPRPRTDAVRVVDYSVALQQARAGAEYDVFAPEGLTPQWRATSARSERGPGNTLLWHLGFVTPAGKYAAVQQSDGAVGPAVERIAGDAAVAGSAQIAGATWERRGEDRGDTQRTLWRSVDGTVVAVTGTARWAELEQLATALRPG